MRVLLIGGASVIGIHCALRLLDAPPASTPPHRVLNVGNHQPVGLLDYIALLEEALGRTAEKQMLPMQPGDVPATYAEPRALQAAVGFAPSTPLAEGLARFAGWFKSCRLQ